MPTFVNPIGAGCHHIHLFGKYISGAARLHRFFGRPLLSSPIGYFPQVSVYHSVSLNYCHRFLWNHSIFHCSHASSYAWLTTAANSTTSGKKRIWQHFRRNSRGTASLNTYSPQHNYPLSVSYAPPDIKASSIPIHHAIGGPCCPVPN